jgi:hypothetical protein
MTGSVTSGKVRRRSVATAFQDRNGIGQVLGGIIGQAHLDSVRLHAREKQNRQNDTKRPSESACWVKVFDLSLL